MIPSLCSKAPFPATARALNRCGMKINDIDLFEVNEAFASIPHGLAPGNRGRPRCASIRTGAASRSAIRSAGTGTKLMATLVHALKARGKRFGLQNHVRRRRPLQRHDCRSVFWT